MCQHVRHQNRAPQLDFSELASQKRLQTTQRCSSHVRSARRAVARASRGRRPCPRLRPRLMDPRPSSVRRGVEHAVPSTRLIMRRSWKHRKHGTTKIGRRESAAARGADATKQDAIAATSHQTQATPSTSAWSRRTPSSTRSSRARRAASATRSRSSRPRTTRRPPSLMLSVR